MNRLSGGLVLVGVIVLFLSASANAQEVQWLRQFGTPFPDGAGSVVTDSTGVYATGSTADALPAQSSAGAFDAFVRKYDSAGQELWTRQFGTSSHDEGLGVAADATGVYVVGRTEGALAGHSSAGSSDAFVRKYDSEGNELWTRQFGTAGHDEALAVATGANGVYVAGTTEGTMPGQSSAGSFDAFFRRYDSAGNELWTRQFGGPSFDFARGAGVDATGAYVAGDLGTVFPVGSTDAFVRKYNSSGSELWSREFGSSSPETAFDVSAGDTGVYVVGSTDGTLPGQVAGGGFPDAFIRRYDSDGAESWTRQFGTSSVDQARGVAVDSTRVYVGGVTQGTLAGQASSGFQDVFVLAFDSDGDEVSGEQLGSALTDGGGAIAVDASGVYVVGALVGLTDAFVARLTKAPPTIPIAGQPAFCGGLPIAPVNGVYFMHANCVLNLHITWFDGLVSAVPQVSSDGGTTWADSTVSGFPPVVPGVQSGNATEPCDWPGPGRWLYRAHGVDSTGMDVYSDPFPYAVSACETQHLQGYEVDGEDPDFVGEDILLTDQFGAETVHIGDARMLLTPVEKRREGRPAEPIQRAENHLKCFRVTGGTRLDRRVRVSNQFTADSTLLVKEPYRFCTPASIGPDGGSLEPPTDGQHYKCYRVEEIPRLAEEVVELVDRFGAARVVVRRAELLCTPVTKQREGMETESPPRPEDELVCYGIRELEVFEPRRVFTLDEFGLQSVRVVDPLVLCVPSTT